MQVISIRSRNRRQPITTHRPQGVIVWMGNGSQLLESSMPCEVTVVT